MSTGDFVGTPSASEQDFLRRIDESTAYSLIVSMRLYDVLMGIYAHLDEDAAHDLAVAHHNGVVLSSAPKFTGEFVTETLNDSTEK